MEFNTEQDIPPPTTTSSSSTSNMQSILSMPTSSITASSSSNTNHHNNNLLLNNTSASNIPLLSSLNVNNDENKSNLNLNNTSLNNKLKDTTFDEKIFDEKIYEDLFHQMETNEIHTNNSITSDLNVKSSSVDDYLNLNTQNIDHFISGEHHHLNHNANHHHLHLKSNSDFSTNLNQLSTTSIASSSSSITATSSNLNHNHGDLLNDTTDHRNIDDLARQFKETTHKYASQSSISSDMLKNSVSSDVKTNAPVLTLAASGIVAVDSSNNNSTSITNAAATNNAITPSSSSTNNTFSNILNVDSLVVTPMLNFDDELSNDDALMGSALKLEHPTNSSSNDALNINELIGRDADVAVSVSGEGKGEELSRQKKILEKYAEDEQLGDQATQALALYSNTNFPNLKNDIKDVVERYRYANKFWRKLDQQSKLNYINKSRQNRYGNKKAAPANKNNAKPKASKRAKSPSGLSDKRSDIVGDSRSATPSISFDDTNDTNHSQMNQLKSAISTEENKIKEDISSSISSTNNSNNNNLNQVIKGEILFDKNMKPIAILDPNTHQISPLPPNFNMNHVTNSNPANLNNMTNSQSQSQNNPIILYPMSQQQQQQQHQQQQALQQIENNKPNKEKFTVKAYLSNQMAAAAQIQQQQTRPQTNQPPPVQIHQQSAQFIQGTQIQNNFQSNDYQNNNNNINHIDLIINEVALGASVVAQIVEDELYAICEAFDPDKTELMSAPATTTTTHKSRSKKQQPNNKIADHLVTSSSKQPQLQKQNDNNNFSDSNSNFSSSIDSSNSNMNNLIGQAVSSSSTLIKDENLKRILSSSVAEQQHQQQLLFDDENNSQHSNSNNLENMMMIKKNIMISGSSSSTSTNSNSQQQQQYGCGDVGDVNDLANNLKKLINLPANAIIRIETNQEQNSTKMPNQIENNQQKQKTITMINPNDFIQASSNAEKLEKVLQLDGTVDDTDIAQQSSSSTAINQQSQQNQNINNQATIQQYTNNNFQYQTQNSNNQNQNNNNNNSKTYPPRVVINHELLNSYGITLNNSNNNNGNTSNQTTSVSSTTSNPQQNVAQNNQNYPASQNYQVNPAFNQQQHVRSIQNYQNQQIPNAPPPVSASTVQTQSTNPVNNNNNNNNSNSNVKSNFIRNLINTDQNSINNSYQPNNINNNNVTPPPQPQPTPQTQMIPSGSNNKPPITNDNTLLKALLQTAPKNAINNNNNNNNQTTNNSVPTNIPPQPQFQQQQTIMQPPQPQPHMIQQHQIQQQNINHPHMHPQQHQQQPLPSPQPPSQVQPQQPPSGHPNHYHNMQMHHQHQQQQQQQMPNQMIGQNNQPNQTQIQQQQQDFNSVSTTSKKSKSSKQQTSVVAMQQPVVLQQQQQQQQFSISNMNPNPHNKALIMNELKNKIIESSSNNMNDSNKIVNDAASTKNQTNVEQQQQQNTKKRKKNNQTNAQQIHHTKDVVPPPPSVNMPYTQNHPQVTVPYHNHHHPQTNPQIPQISAEDNKLFKSYNEFLNEFNQIRHKMHLSHPYFDINKEAFDINLPEQKHVQLLQNTSHIRRNGTIFNLSIELLNTQSNQLNLIDMVVNRSRELVGPQKKSMSDKKSLVNMKNGQDSRTKILKHLFRVCTSREESRLYIESSRSDFEEIKNSAQQVNDILNKNSKDVISEIDAAFDENTNDTMKSGDQLLRIKKEGQQQQHTVPSPNIDMLIDTASDQVHLIKTEEQKKSGEEVLIDNRNRIRTTFKLNHKACVDLKNTIYKLSELLSIECPSIWDLATMIQEEPEKLVESEKNDSYQSPSKQQAVQSLKPFNLTNNYAETGYNMQSLALKFGTQIYQCKFCEAFIDQEPLILDSNDAYNKDELRFCSEYCLEAYKKLLLIKKSSNNLKLENNPKLKLFLNDCLNFAINKENGETQSSQKGNEIEESINSIIAAAAVIGTNTGTINNISQVKQEPKRNFLKWNQNILNTLGVDGSKLGKNNQSDVQPRNKFEVYKEEKCRENRQCVFCNLYGDLESNGPGRLLTLDIDKWCHLNCALWSDDVYETMNGALINVDQAYKNSLDSQCFYCHQKGASLKCFTPKCNCVYHLPCALKDKCAFNQDKTVFCSAHSSKTPSGLQCENRLNDLTVTRSVWIERDEVGQLQNFMNREYDESYYSIRIGSLILHQVGQLLPHQLSSGLFNNRQFIYPIGYRITRIYWSVNQCFKRCR
jgi:hypothetical protein